MVFYHRCLPLSVSLREETASAVKSRWDMRFKNLMSHLSRALHSESNDLSEAWDFEYDNLWRHRWGNKPFSFCSPREQIGILSARTFWYKRLKPHNKNLLKKLLERKRGLELKEILHVADGMLSSLIMSYPEIFCNDPVRPYAEADRIMCSLISNGLQDYAGQLARLKGFKKRLRKAAFLGEKVELTEPEQRSHSWLEAVVNHYNQTAGVQSKANMFRVCVFTQTRSTGLANQKMADATLQGFLDEVTSVKQFNPDNDLVESIDWVLDGVVAGAVGGNPQFRISMSTSACTENNKRNEGKFGYLKKCPDRPSLPKFSPTNPGGQLGTWAFNKAKAMINSSDEAIFKTNIAAIRENGKCRVVTSGSFYKDAFLQPFSHMTIAAIKTQKSLRQGLSAGRLGWAFISRVDHLDPVDGHVLFEKKKRIMSVDWEKATDIPPHKSAHAVTSRLLDKMRLSKELRDTLDCIWPGCKDLYVKGKYVCQMVNGIPMGDPLTKTNISLAHPICEAYAHRRVPGVKIVHAGNGDDTVVIAAADTDEICDRWFEEYNRATVQLGYRLSPLDTFVTSTWGTYCEEVFHIPVDRFNTVRTASKLKDNRYLPYLDHPKMRLVIDTKKDRGDYSSDITGKVTLLGKDQQYAEQGEEGHLFSVASAMQDVCLGVRYEQRPMYLPREIFSVGKMPAFWNTESWANAIWSMPQKVVNITVRALKELMGDLPTNLTELRAVKSGERHFDGEAVAEVFTIPDDDPIKQLVTVRREDAKKIPPGVLERLVESKHLTTSKEVEALYLFMKRLEELEQVVHNDLFEMLRTKVSVLREYSKEDTLKTCEKFKSKFFKQQWTLRRPFEVDYYLTHHIDELRSSDPRTVNIEFDYVNRFAKRLRPDSVKTRAEEELYEWFVRNVDNILEENEYDLPPTQLLEDDPYILQRIGYNGVEVNIIVTDDRKLCRLAQNKFTEKIIMRISIKDWVFIDADERAVIDAIYDDLKVTPAVLVDEGSLDTFLWKTDISPNAYAKWGDPVNVKKTRTQEEVYDVYQPPVNVDRSNVYNFVEIVNTRVASRVFGRRLRG
jgi:hypothetical protein